MYYTVCIFSVENLEREDCILDQELEDNTPSTFKYTLLHTGYLSNVVLSDQMGFHFKDRIMTFYGKGIEPFNLTFNQDLYKILSKLICDYDKYEYFRKKIVIGKRTCQSQIYEEMKKITGKDFKLVQFKLQDIPYNQHMQRLLAIGRLKAFVGKNTEVNRYFHNYELFNISKWVESQKLT